MDGMFKGAESFNGDLSRWNVGNVTDMAGMFWGVESFNGDLSRWDVRNVTDMTAMFRGAAAFNGDLSRWNVGNVTNMSNMFVLAMAFNGDLRSWDVRNVTDMSAMFAYAWSFNGDLSGWDVRNVTDMSGVCFTRPRPSTATLSGWGRAQRHGHGQHVQGRRGLQRRPGRLGRAPRHEHAQHVPKHAGAEPQAHVVHRKRLRRLGLRVNTLTCVPCRCFILNAASFSLLHLHRVRDFLSPLARVACRSPAPLPPRATAHSR